MTPQVFRQLFWNAIKKWYDDGASRHGAAIAYYTLFARAPVLPVVIAIAGLVFGAAAVRGQIVNEIAALIGRDGAEAIQAIVQRASEPREGIGARVYYSSQIVLLSAELTHEYATFRKRAPAAMPGAVRDPVAAT